VETEDSIRAFWFGDGDDATAAREKSSLWWSKDEAVDRAMRERFEPALQLAAARGMDGWRDTPQGLLALILLTDQFPRNIYRNTPQAFAFDPLALTWCKDGIDRGADRALRPIERVFFYLPLEHSESLHDQYLAVALFDKLREADSMYAGYHDFAIRHRDIIERFGRFPHRNAILGRESTPEELAFLQEKGSSF
jgi:uncharacterized protein (DUF924 family)